MRSVTQHNKEYVDWAIQQTGAIGFITDFMREMQPVRKLYDLGDALNYVSFWWKHIEGEPQVGGFTLSLRAAHQTSCGFKNVKVMVFPGLIGH